MDRNDITKEQAKEISKGVEGQLAYLFQLRAWLEKRGFPHDDSLYVEVCNAYDAVYYLRIRVHYLTCDGVGQPSKPNKPDGEEPQLEEDPP